MRILTHPEPNARPRTWGLGLTQRPIRRLIPVILALSALTSCATAPSGLDPGPAVVSGTWTLDPEKTLEVTFDAQRQNFQALPADRRAELIRSFPIYLQLTFSDSGTCRGVMRQNGKEEKWEGRCRILFRSASEVRFAVEEEAQPPREILTELKGVVLLLRFGENPRAVFAMIRADKSTGAAEPGT